MWGAIFIICVVITLIYQQYLINKLTNHTDFDDVRNEQFREDLNEARAKIREMAERLKD